MGKEFTMVIIKPGAVREGVAGKIIARFEKTGMTIEKMKLDKYPRVVIEELYKEHKDKGFYEDLIQTIADERIVVMILSGQEGIIQKVRKMNGATNPLLAAPGTIRGDYGSSFGSDNVVHASDSREAAIREINIFFPDFLDE